MPAVEDAGVDAECAGRGEGVVVGCERHVGHAGVGFEEDVRLAVEPNGDGGVFKQSSFGVFDGLDGEGVEFAVLEVFVEQKLVPVARVVAVAHLFVVDIHAAGTATAHVEVDKIVFPNTVCFYLARVDD